MNIMKKIFTIMAMLMLTVGIFAQDLAVSMKTDKLTGSNITLSLVAGGTGSFYIDWGDGTLNPYTISGNTGAPTTITQAIPVDKAVIKLYVQGKYITFLTCSNNELTELDVTPSSTIVYLRCFTNKLTSIDVSTNLNLALFYPYGNQLTSLDVSNNTKISDLQCGTNKITNITGLENLTALRVLATMTNPLTHTLNIREKTALQTINARNCNQTSLDVTGCTALTTIEIFNGGATYANNFSACDLDDLYNTLPDRTGLATANLRVIYTPANPLGNDVDGSDKTIATAKNWNVNYYNSTVSYFTGDGGGCISTNNLAPDLTDFSLSPNPTKGLVQINIAGETSGRHLRIMDISGRLIQERTVTAAEMTLDTSGFPKGVYLISTGRNIQKLVVE
jgi:hypothetical protein